MPELLISMILKNTSSHPENYLYELNRNLMRKFALVILLISSFRDVHAQDNCASAVVLCANNIITRSTVGATASGTDPALSCGDNTVNNSVWFSILAVNNGTCTVTVSNINNTPGLEMQVYSGSCGSLSAVGPCASGDAAGGGSMALSFATIAGTTYYIMVDGTSGNQEAFNILATTNDDGIVARPDANFNTNPSYGCIPLDVQLQNTTQLHGGSNITYEWRIDTGPYLPSGGNDTTITLSTSGLHSITLRVCNTECGCKTLTQDIIVQDLVPSISYSPQGACIGTELTFTGSAQVLPDPPYVDPAVTDWQWNFGDPASGINNTASGQSVSHTFVGSGGVYTVSLITEGTCGPDTVQTTVVLRPRPTVSAGAPQLICEGSVASLSASTINLTSPITYSWTGPGSFSCDTCQNTSLSGLAAGGPYSIQVSVIDSFACTADTMVVITVNPKPVVDAGPDVQVCRYDSTVLNALVLAGSPPFTYSWSPSGGLNNSTIPNPTAVISAPASYCVEISDSIGCVSDPDCLDLTLFPLPVISAAVPVLCASQTPLQNTFTVNGAGIGSDYSWSLSQHYSLITTANADSSSITVTFPSGIAASYSFTVVVIDGITGCQDTVQTVFSVTGGLNMSITGPSSACRGDMVSLTASGASSYNWTANPAYAFADPTQAVQNVSPLVTTIFTVTGLSGSCNQTITDTLIISPKPVASAQPLTPQCGCATISLDGSGSTAGMIYHWSSAGGGVISDTLSATTTASACTDDIFTLLVIDTASGCFEDTSIVLDSRPRPDANVAVNPGIICNGSVTLINLDGSGSNTDPGTTYFWSSGNPSVVIDDTAIILTTATVITSTTFYLTVTDSLGCDSTASAVVQVYPLPAFFASNSFLCTSDPVLESTLEIIGAASGSTYDWISIPACVAPNSSTFDSQTFDFSSCPIGVYTFTVVVTNSITSCVDTLNQTVQVINGVNLMVSSDTVICEGGTLTLTAAGANSYLWSTGDTMSFISLPALTAAASPYTFTVSGSAGSCSDTDTISVIVNPVPLTSSISGPSAVCAGDTSITYSVTPPAGNYTWLVQGGTITSGQNTNSITVNWDSSGTGLITVADTNGFGCPGNTQNITISISSLPDSSTTILGPDSVCEFSNALYFVVANAGSNYTWSVNGGIITGPAIADNIQVNWSVSGIGTISVYETNALGCAGPVITRNFVINPRPLPPPVNGDQLVCDSSQSIYYTNPGPGSTIDWIVNGGSIVSTSANMDTITVFWTNTGIGSIRAVEINSYGCPGDTTDIQVNVNIKPQAFVQPDSAAICQNSSFAITGAATGTGIRWLSSGSGTFSDTSIASPVYYPGTSDTGFVSLHMIVYSAPCIADTASLLLYVAAAPQVSITGSSNTICFGENDTLSATGGGSYLWTPGGSTTSVIVVSPPVSTTYYLSVTNSTGCMTTDSVRVTVNPPGIPDAGNDQLICRGDSIGLSGTQSGGGGYLWTSLGDGVFIPSSTAQQVTYIPGPADTTTGQVFIVLATTGYCLNLTDTMLLMVSDFPTVNAGADTTITGGPGTGVAIPLVPQFTNAAGIIWSSSGTGTFSPSASSIPSSYHPSNEDFLSDSVILTVEVTGACTTSGDLLIIRFTPFDIPNVITPYPSSPDFNDYFVIKNLPVGSRLKIWDRWGVLVFSTEDYLNNWEAQGLSSGVYYYVLGTPKKDYKGWLQVIRE